MAKKKEAKEKTERTYNIPLRKKFRNTAKHKKTPKAVRTLKEFLKKHMKSENIRLGMHLNEYLWKHGIKNPPHHARVHVIKEGDVVNAELEGFEFKEAIKIIEKKKGPKTMKDKLSAKLGVKDVPREEKQEDKKEEKQKPEEKKAEKAEEVKTTGAKKASEPPKTESQKPEPKPEEPAPKEQPKK